MNLIFISLQQAVMISLGETRMLHKVCTACISRDIELHPLQSSRQIALPFVLFVVLGDHNICLNLLGL